MTLYIDPERETLYRDGVEVALTRRERELLAIIILAKRSMRAAEIADRMEPVGGKDEFPEHGVRVLVARLRVKLGPEAIPCSRGGGYVWRYQIKFCPECGRAG